MKHHIFWFVLFLSSSTSSMLVNKYVLSNLHFTFPTIFQSWQMFVVASLLVMLHGLGLLELQQFSLATIKSWIPTILLFTVSIYSGSVSLSKLPVPIFCLIQQTLTNSSIMFSDTYTRNHQPTMYQLFTFFGSFTSFLIIIKLDEDFSISTYKWIFLHCVSVACYSYYAVHISNTQMNEIDKMMINSISSILLLLLYGYLSGETIAVQEFPLVFKRHFHIGCLGSGIFGAGVIVSYSHLTQLVPVAKVRLYNSFAMLIVCCLSMFIFNTALTAVMVIVILFGLSNVLLFVYLNSQTQEENIDNPIEPKVLSL